MEQQLKVISESKKNRIYQSIATTLLCAIGFLLVIYHIANGETNIVSASFEILYVGIPLVLIILGFGMSVEKAGNSIAKWMTDNWYVAVYILLRIASCLSNELIADSRFWISLCYETFFLIAINKATVSTTSVRVFFCILVAFDLITVSICSYSYFFLNDMMTTAVSSYSEEVQTWLPFTLIFTNPNPAGMLAGITASIGILLFSESSRISRMLLGSIVIINSVFMIWSNSRTSMIGTAAIFLIAITRRFVKRVNSKTVLATAMIACIIFMIPVYIMTLAEAPEMQLQNSETEILLNDISSERYNIWKENILSQKGHYLLGFGTTSKAVIARTEYVKESLDDMTVEVDDSHQKTGERTDWGAHNGYMELILTAGLPATILVLAFLFSKINDLDNDFIERHPIILLLVFLFWINVQESRFIMSGVRYTAFIIMILLNWRENETTF